MHYSIDFFGIEHKNKLCNGKVEERPSPTHSHLYIYTFQTVVDVAKMFSRKQNFNTFKGV